MNDSLNTRIGTYKNTFEHNSDLHKNFTVLTDSIPLLRKHRDFIEQNNWGFGDRAFHYLWWLLLVDARQLFNPLRALEIGVYKGQVISLWSLICKELKCDVSITAISPFEGNTKVFSRIERKLRLAFDTSYREAAKAGNLYVKSDYVADVRRVFSLFALDEGELRLIKGCSNESAVSAQVQGERFSIVYIDGDHSFSGVRSDIDTYAPLVEGGGYLVMDDASFFLPGTGFFKGVEGVSRACEEIPTYGFVNVLNVGHNRVYRKT
jgi:hypothetical protein